MSGTAQSSRGDLASEVVARDCNVSFTRRSGPGGQNRNKVETAVVLTHRPTGTVAEANEQRSQAANREAALARLQIALALTTRKPWDADASASRLWQSRCRGGRIEISPTHADFALILAEALDAIAGVGNGVDVAAAARALDCSPSQLIKLLKKHPLALSRLNQARREQGLQPLR